ncbi:MAG: hypothetical protein Q8L14_10795 [Myxococcales bacterium]|nr:hypothetical protein [Myxococcales bacterium]
MNARAAVLLGLLSSCSVLFDPSMVALSGCPTTAERCSTPANARAICQASACAFECFEGFRDADGVADTGCEASCAVLAAPASLNVTSVTDGTSLTWAFSAVANAASYRLCTGVAAGTPTCVTVSPSDCTGGTCRVQTTGHPLKAQVSGQVQTANGCQASSAETRATGFTVRTNEVIPWTSDSACMPMVSTAGDVLSVEQNAFCVGSAAVGDEQWRGGTFEVELRPTGVLGANVMGGLVFSNGTRRIGLALGPTTVPVTEGATVLRESKSNGPWRFLATSGVALTPDEWNRVRVVIKDGVWSISVGRGPEPLREVLRYVDGASAAEPWRVGLHTLTPNLFASGRIEFKNFTLSTATEFPSTGATAQAWAFEPAGPRPAARVSGAPGTNIRFESCPAFPAATACSSTTSCAPDGGVCARLVKNALGGGSMIFDVPPGLDTRAAWSVRFRFAGAADGGFNGGAIASSPSGVLLEPENGWDGGVRGLGGRWGLPVSADTWNFAELTFDPVMGSFSARLNGQSASITPRFPPSNFDPFVGAIIVGGVGLQTGDVWLSDLSITQ